MKTGICPKCKSPTVYKKKLTSSLRSQMRFSLLTIRFLDDYICVTCGYSESYLQDLTDVGEIKKHCLYITPYKEDNENENGL